MVKFDITDYISGPADNYYNLKDWLLENVGSIDGHWYAHESKHAHVFECKGNGWQIVWRPTSNSTKLPLRLIDWILEIEEDLVAVQVKLMLPEASQVQ